MTDELSVALRKNAGAAITPLACGPVPLDIDVFTRDNREVARKASCAPKPTTDGYAPIAAYLSQEGGCVVLKLREGSRFLTTAIFDAIDKHLAGKGLMMRIGTIIDATIIAAPSSTKKRQKPRPRHAPNQERQKLVLRHEGTHRGGCRVFLVHTVIGTPANVNDVVQARDLLHGK